MNKPLSSFPCQLDFMIGKPESHKHPLDKVSDEQLCEVLKNSELSEKAVIDVINVRGKYRDLLMKLYEAGQKEDFKLVNIIADTLAVGTGNLDPRQKDSDLTFESDAIPAHANRPWYNG